MYLITGADGQLGKCLQEYLGLAYFTDRDQLDITDMDSVKAYAKDKNFSAIINCAAYTAVDKAEEDIEMCRKINVDGPRNLAQLAAERNIPIVHISTDYVFGATNAVALKEDDAKTPIGVYGKTKLEGEEEIKKYAGSYVIIRTSWLYSKYGNNFFKTMLKLGAERDEIKVVADQYGTPTYAPDLAAVILEILERAGVNIKDTYHFSNEGAATWYDFAHTILYRKGLKCKVTPIKTSEYPTKASRPVFSVLDKSKIKRDFSVSINHWTKGVDKCLQQIS